MRSFSFFGTSKRNEAFVRSVSQHCADTDSFISQLNKLGMFTSITPTDSGIKLEDKKNNISFSGDTTSETPRGLFIVKLPNLFGKAESFELSVSTSKDVILKLTKPILGSRLSFLSIKAMSDIKKVPNVEFSTSTLEAEYKAGTNIQAVGIEKMGTMLKSYCDVQKKIFGTSLRFKIGAVFYHRINTFCKFEITRKFTTHISNILFHSMELSIGTLLGTSHITEKYFLGKNVRGYKNMAISPVDSNQRTGGNSFLEINNKAGIDVGYAKLFLFSSFGYCSRHANVAEMLRAAAMAIKAHNSTCLGASIGLGCNIPITKIKDGSHVDMSFAIPLTDNENIEKFQCKLSIDF